MVDDAEQQLEFLSEIQQSIGKSAVSTISRTVPEYFFLLYILNKNTAMHVDF